jgi:hypothetical protein
MVTQLVYITPRVLPKDIFAKGLWPLSRRSLVGRLRSLSPFCRTHQPVVSHFSNLILRRLSSETDTDNYPLQRSYMYHTKKRGGGSVVDSKSPTVCGSSRQKSTSSLRSAQNRSAGTIGNGDGARQRFLLQQR